MQGFGVLQQYEAFSGPKKEMKTAQHNPALLLPEKLEYLPKFECVQ